MIVAHSKTAIVDDVYFYFEISAEHQAPEWTILHRKLWKDAIKYLLMQ